MSDAVTVHIEGGVADVRLNRPEKLNALNGDVIADLDHTEPDTVALRAFNDRVAGDKRVEAAILPAFDGLTIARKL